MNRWWSMLIGLAVLTAGAASDSALASDRNGTAWKKVVNFNNPQPRRAIVKIKKAKPAHVARASSPSSAPQPAPPRILATFELDPGAVALAPPDEPVAPVKPAPGKCEWVQSIVVGYAFEDVTPKICTGSVFTYEARRGDRTYLVQASALNGELVKVEHIDAPQDEATVTIEPASQ